MKTIYFLLLAVLSLVFSVNAKSQDYKTYDPEIQSMVNAIDSNHIFTNISYLLAYDRYATDLYASQASNFLLNYLNGLAFDERKNQYVNGISPNVIAKKTGTLYPDSVIIVGAHYDVYAANAPGVDDNGSGTVALMAIDSVISSHDYNRTIRLIFFSGEEQGNKGSQAYLNDPEYTDDKVAGVFCLDGIAYLKPGDPINADVYLDSVSKGLRATYATCTGMYVPNFPVANVTWPAAGFTSDIQAFWNKGYKAIMPCEGQYDQNAANNHTSPFRHTMQDEIGTSANSKTQAAKIAQSVLATVVSMAGISHTGVNENVNIANSYLNIFPNPVSSEAIVKFYTPQNEKIKLSVYNVFGQTVQNLVPSTQMEGVHDITFFTSDLENGVYFLKMDLANFSITKKIIISK